MASLLANTCWPSRFWTKWLIFFFGAALLGMVLAAWKLRPIPNVRATIFVKIKYPDTDPQPIDADVWGSRTLDEIIDQHRYRDFPVTRYGYERSYTGNRPVDLYVWPYRILGGHKQYEGKLPFHWTPRWPSEANQKVELTITRDYPSGSARWQNAP